jgi:hypothetical protein
MVRGLATPKEKLMSPLDHSALPDTGASATAHVIEGLETFGYTPNAEDIDQRPAPEPEDLDSALSAIYQILSDTLMDTCLEPDLEDVLWQLTSVFHRKSLNVQRQLDDNEARQRSSQDQQDGSEIRSVELENLIAHGQLALQRRDAFESCRDMAAEHFQAITGSAWKPRSGTLANRKSMTASVIDSRDWINAKKYQETHTLTPPGTLIAISGGTKFNNVDLIFSKLDALLARFPDMILIHGGYHEGADHIASLWARNRNVTEMPFKPDFKRFGASRAGFVRNDEILKLRPRGILVFDGTGVQHQIAREAKKAGIPVNDYRTEKDTR